MGGIPKIASLLPSATEIVCALGLGERLVGVSHECDFPEEVLELPKLTSVAIDPDADSAAIDRAVRERLAQASSLYRVDAERLAALRPDVIVTQDHCEVCAVSLDEVDSACKTFGLDARVVALFPGSLRDVGLDFVRVAEACGARERGDSLLRSFTRRLDAVRGRAEGRRRPRVSALEWLDPPMPATGYLRELIALAGGDLVDRDPEILFVAPCGYSIDKSLRELSFLERKQEGRKAGREIDLCSRARVWIADGNAYFNRPGPRLADSAEILSGIFGHSALRAGARVWP